jgi:lipoteichoic acid synthase
VLVASQEALVPLTITNTGSRRWDPARVHLSYHWLWIVPRELASRSRWNLPYHDGIRTTLPAAVAPAARASLNGRLLAPSAPGVYWLQWDMVEEGVAWFAQVSPRQRRRLIVVLPPAAAAFAPLPLLVALAGVVTLGRARQPAPGAVVLAGDVIWCAATLFSKQLLLVPEALLEPDPVAYWLMTVTAVMPPLLLALLVPGRLRPWAMVVCGALGTLLVFADVLYYRFFGDVLSVPAMLAARQTGHVWGSIRSLLTPGLMWFAIDVPCAAWLGSRLQRAAAARLRPRRSEWLVAAALTVILGVAGLLVSAPRVLAADQFDQMFRNRTVVEHLGPLGFHAYDAFIYARARWLHRAATGDEVEQVRAWFDERAPLRAGLGPAFGLARGSSLIVIQVESLQDFVVDYQVNGQEVMPHLRRWAADSLRFTNVTDQTSEGRTSDAEFTTLVSLLPLEHGAVAFRYPGNRYVGLPAVLREHGYRTLSAVPFEAGFWNRRVMHPSYGFEQSLFEPDFILTEQIGWGLNDRDFLRQMVPHLERLARPFCAWLITLSLHHPFEDFPERHKTLRLGALDRTPFGNYLHTMHFFDEALEAFTAALAGNHLLDHAVLVVFGDHDAGFANEPGLARLIGLQDGPAAGAIWLLNDRVPVFVRIPGPGLAKTEMAATDVPAGQTDLAPTLLALLGIDPAPLPYMGRNLLGSPDDPPIVRPYGDWLDRSHLFMSPAAGGRGPACYAVAAGRFENADRCRAAGEIARRTRDISRLVVTADLQQRLRRNPEP